MFHHATAKTSDFDGDSNAMNRQKITGRENVVTIKVKGGRTATFERATDNSWNCREFPLPRPAKHLRDAVKHVRLSIA